MQTNRPSTETRRNSQDTGGRASETSGALAAGRKFMLTLRDSIFKDLQKSAEQRGVTIQGLIRAVIVPEWHIEHAPLIRKATTQDYSVSQDQLVKESVSIPTWPRTRKTVEEDIPANIVS